MLTTRPEEQETLFKEIMFKKLNVREAEAIARGIAVDRIRKKERLNDPEIDLMVARLNDALGTRVFIEKREKGGKVVIDFFDQESLHNILDIISKKKEEEKKIPEVVEDAKMEEVIKEEVPESNEDEGLYSVKNFSL